MPKTKLKLKKDGTPSRQGEGGGKPPIFKNDRKFQEALLDYLRFCEKKKKMPNVAGFCARHWMGRRTYYDLAKKYPLTTKAFESSLENVWVDRLGSASATGAIFYLKNAFREEYKDRTETDITSGGKPIPILGNVPGRNSNKKDSILNKKD